MRIGYACLTLGVPDTALKSCMSKNADEERLLDLISHNINSLENIIDYNIANNIQLFRISSDIIPFGSSPVNKLPWWDIFSSRFIKLGEKIKNSGMRVSMHPGQYTVLNSPDEGVVKRAIDDLDYHTRMLDSLGVGPEHKIVLHIGGIYNDKNQAMERFVANYNRLSNEVKQRLVVENDDKSYNIKDVLEIGNMLNIPVIFDNLHNIINPYDEKESELTWINHCKGTWREWDGPQKIHYSQQDPSKKPGSHSSTIEINEFMEFYEGLEGKDIDIMLEVKDKNLSAVKCINCTRTDKNIKFLEFEWSKYKYKILENSPENYLEIRKLLRSKEDYPSVLFYNLIEEALKREDIIGNAINAAQHVWGYFKNSSSDKEKDSFLKAIDGFKEGKTSIKTLKNILWKLSIKYNQGYLLNSYYFVL